MEQKGIFKGKNKLPTFKVTGGLGKHIVFSALLPALYKKYGEFHVLSAYPEVFFDAPEVQLSLGFSDFEQAKEECSKVIEKVYYKEPYGTEFDFNSQHILDWWIEAYQLDDGLVDNPKLTCNEELQNQAKDVKEVSDKYIFVQFSGGQSPSEFSDQSIYQQTDMVTQRNYPYQMAQILVNKLKFQYPEYTIYNVSLPNEYNLYNTERLPIGFKVYKELVDDALVVICIDSMLQHIAATSDKHNTIVLWNQLAYTPKDKYGWVQHYNLQEPNMCIDYNVILDKVRGIYEKTYNDHR